jgi:hypothetical protein
MAGRRAKIHSCGAVELHELGELGELVSGGVLLGRAVGHCLGDRPIVVVVRADRILKRK